MEEGIHERLFITFDGSFLFLVYSHIIPGGVISKFGGWRESDGVYAKEPC